jgi:DNA topoisomerase IB
VKSDDVNDYLRRVSGLDVTAKTFRTWGATVLAAAGLAAVADTAAPLRPRVIQQVVAAVADELHNTPAVCRASYIHPAVFDTFNAGTLEELWKARPRQRPRDLVSEEHHLLHVLEHAGERARTVNVGTAPPPRTAAVKEELEAVREVVEESVGEVAEKLRAR